MVIFHSLLCVYQAGYLLNNQSFFFSPVSRWFSVDVNRPSWTAGEKKIQRQIPQFKLTKKIGKNEGWLIFNVDLNFW